MLTAQKYSDGLITITETELVLHTCYLNGKDKTVLISDIEKILVKKPTVWNGKWRLWGTGNIRTWFSQDLERPRRDRIFFAVLKNQWRRIGFTVKDERPVTDIFRHMNLIKE
jgi:hypothetical protein